MGLSLGHLLILSVILLLFGTRKLPELATALGKSARAFREALDAPEKSEIQRFVVEDSDGEGNGKMSEDKPGSSTKS